MELLVLGMMEFLRLVLSYHTRLSIQGSDADLTRCCLIDDEIHKRGGLYTS